MAFRGWESSPWLLDPISEERKSKKMRGASNFPLPEIFQIITNLENLDTTNTLVWRGHDDAKHPIITKLQRQFEKTHPGKKPDKSAFLTEQQNVLELAHKRSIGHSKFGIDEPLQTYAELQHHGVPTHLLDITLDPLTALWFACHDRSKKSDGMLFAISVSKFDQQFTSDRLSIEQDQTGPIYLRPSAPDKRMLVQRAAFIVPTGPTTKNSSGFENVTKTKGNGLSETLRKKLLAPTSKNPPNRPPACYFVAIKIPKASKDWITKRLESGGKLTHESLYPDIYGLAQTYVH